MTKQLERAIMEAIQWFDNFEKGTGLNGPSSSIEVARKLYNALKNQRELDEHK
jgi:hypothetical protein